jgi:hypothetical protein
LEKLGLTKSAADHTLFYCSTSHNKYCLLGVATDNFTYVANSTETIKKLKKEMGELSWILGVEVKRNLKAHTLTFFQTSYINHIL